MNHALLILAAGASSRMKTSQATAALTKSEIEAANTKSKALLQVGPLHRPVLDYLLVNAEKAGYKQVYLIVPPHAEAFTSHYGQTFKSLKISYVTQYIPEGKTKPMGTADALLQALEQFPVLQQQAFTVCNSDNLYSVEALQALIEEPSENALIAYDRDGLHFSMERIKAFALLLISAEGYVKDIIEKPSPEQASAFQDAEGRFRVSMNLWKLNGSDIFQSLKQLEPHPVRKEKELPSAVLHMSRALPKKIKAIPSNEHVPDLTSKEDITALKEYIRQHYDSGD